MATSLTHKPLMLTWWISEAVPIPVTAMLPIVLFPLLDVMPIKQTTMTYGHPIVFLFMGGFVIALAMEKWHLHRRIALGILCKTGTHANGIIGGFMLATAFLSMWVSNTATTVMMLPIAMSVLELLLGDKRGKAATMGQRHFALALMLGIAYAANIGGTSTLIGTPPNAVFAGFIETRFGYQVDFMRWAMVGLPFAVLMLGICWWVLVHMMYPNQLGEIEGAGQMIDKEYQNLGAMSRGERSVLVVFVLTA